MATSSDWEARKQRREEQQRIRKAKQRKMLIILLGVVAVLALIITLIVVFSGKKEETQTDEPQTQVQQAQDENQPEEEATQPTKEDPNLKTIRIAAAGDVNVTDRIVNSGGLNYDYTSVFMDVAHMLADADLAVVNLEGNICGAPYGSGTASAPQGLVDALDKAGVDLVQLANSYSINKGISGLKQTINGIRAAGMEPLGVYEDESAFRAGKGYTVCVVDGIKVAFVAFTKGMDGRGMPNGNEDCVNLLYEDYSTTYQKVNTEGITKILKSVASEKPDLTVALLHWGSEYNDNISKTQESIVNLMQKQGVDAIIGTHSHMVHEITYDEVTGQFVAYSLGDFFGDGSRGGTNYSILLDLEITMDHEAGTTMVTGYDYTPIYILAEDECDGDRRVIRIDNAINAYEGNYVDKVTKACYDSMKNALERIAARVAGK